MLITIVIFCNIVIFSFNLYIIWKISKIKKTLARIADIFTYLEENFNLLFQEYSLSILQTALEIKNLNHKYKSFHKLNQQCQQILIIVRLGYQIYRQKFI